MDTATSPKGAGAAAIVPLATSSGILSIRTTEAPAMFATSRLNFKPIGDIDHMAVSNNMLIVLMGQHVLRLTLSPNAPPVEEVKPLPADYRVLRIFLDPHQGSHLLLAVVKRSKSPAASGGGGGAAAQPELWYLNRSMQEARRCDRFRGHEVTAVGFNQANGSDASTGAILLGTSRGLLFETELSCTDGDQRKGAQANWKQVFDIGKGEHCPITGIQLLKVPQTVRHLVFVTTPTRLYKFHEVISGDEKTPYLHHIFNPYLNVPEQVSDFTEIQHSSDHSSLRFRRPNGAFPTAFAWLTDACILHGDMSANCTNDDCLLDDGPRRIPLPSGGAAPISMVLTEFHALLLYKDHVRAISLLDHQPVYEEHFADQHGDLVAICMDAKTGRAYMCGRRAIFRFRINGEARNVWRIYLERNQFELAAQYCQDLGQRATVLVKQADQLFAAGDYLGAAAVYAQTRSSFEAVCLRFLRINEKEALMVFLRSRLESLRPAETTQTTMLVVWMVDLYLTQIAEQQLTGGDASRARILQKEFEAFMRVPPVAKCITSVRSVVYDLMASHGDTANLRALTTAHRDFEVVINEHLNQSAFGDALAVLCAQNRAELVYKYAPILMEELPVETGALMRGSKLKLDPERLLPALMCVDTDVQRAEVMRYIEFSIQYNGCRCKALHNYAIKLYAAHNQAKLLEYFHTQDTDVASVPYDVQYALRVCQQHNAHPASVFLQCLLGLWHQAVELALTFDAKLAQETAARTGDPALQRKLWLRIAEHSIRGTDNVKQALRLLNECDGLLRIEDVLPYFSDFERIGHFKEAICNALKQYNEEISLQRSEMEASAASADLVRAELKSFRNRSVTVAANEQCHTCATLLLSKPFYLFPCGHKFHADCLAQQVKACLPPDQVHRLDESTMAAECVLCGNHMIECIDRPFIENWDRVVSEWL